MSTSDRDAVFTDSIAQIYQQWLVPLLFEPFAADLARRVALREPASVLEIAAGTGVVTRQLAQLLPATVSIIATDLNQPMLDEAAAVGTARSVEWRQADALHLPFADELFDVVVCQFGVMFFPDKRQAFAEARRVLRPHGQFIFNVWDRIEENEWGDSVTAALASMFPTDPPRFLARVPYGYHDPAVIAADLAQGGFTQAPVTTTLPVRSRADGPRIPAVALCQGTVLRSEIEARGPGRLAEATDSAAAAIAQRFGAGAVDAKMQAVILTVGR